MTDTAQADAPKPAPKPRRTFTRVCPECQGKFTTTTKDRLFCTDAHKAAFHNRSNKIGRALVPLAQAWRDGRNAKGHTPEAKALRASAMRAFSDMCRLLDEASSEDRKEGRMPKLEYLRRRWRLEGTLRPDERVEVQQAKADQRAKLLAKAKAETQEKAK